MLQERIEAEAFLELNGVSFHRIYPLLIRDWYWIFYTANHAYI